MPTRLNDATRYRQRKRYYAKHRVNARNAYQPWTNRQVEAVMKRDMPDSQLAPLIGRSVEAIQIMRCRLRSNTEVSDSADNERTAANNYGLQIANRR